MQSAKTQPWLLLSLLLLAANFLQQCVHGEQQVPCFFIYGGTLSDHGNNNNLPTRSKSNYRPYGIDFPQGSTGRYTNGKTQVDIIGEFLGFNRPIPPFTNINDSDILKGVNYASGSAGIRRETGTHLGSNFNLESQIRNHRIIYNRIAIRLGSFEKAQQYLSKCLYYVHIGNNDYIYNYFLPQFYLTSIFFNTEQYAQNLMNSYSQSIQILRRFGARKFVLLGVGRIGCTPYAIAMHRTNGSCVEEMNTAASIFNAKLRVLVDEFMNKFGGDSKFTFVNNTARNLGVVARGFTVTNASCCPTGSDVLCDPNQTPCQNRNQYVFWDKFSSTEAFNKFIALLAYNGSNPAFVYPFTIKTLLQS